MIEALERRVLLASSSAVPQYVNGLAATYWDNFDFSGPSVHRIDSSVNFNWRKGSPDSKIVADTFSARWTGYVQAAKSETFTFYTSSDDGVRLLIDGKRVIDKWKPQNQTEYRATFALTAAKKHAVSLEYFERAGAAVMELAWSSASTPRQIIPSTALFTQIAHAPSSDGGGGNDDNGGGDPVTTAPSAPQGVAASAPGLGRVDVVWSDVTGESSYRIERSFDPAGPWDSVASVAADTTTYNDPGVLANTRYFYRVRALNSAGTSAASGSYAEIRTPGVAPYATLRVSPNRRYLLDAQGRPFMWTSDTAWHLFDRTTREEATLYLKTRAAQGFNVIQTLVDLSPGVNNRYGQPALINNSPDKPNDAFFHHVDYVVDRAASLGLTIVMAPMSSGAFLSGQFSLAQAFNYGKWVGQRYRNKPVVWMMGMDSDPTQAKNGLAVVRAMADGVAAGAADGNHGNVTITFMAPFNESSKTWFNNDPWLDFSYIQSGHHVRDAWELVKSDWQQTPTRPTIDGETTFEDIPWGLQIGNRRLDPWDVRKMRYWGLFAGGLGVSYGHNDVWQMWTSGVRKDAAPQKAWYDSLNAPAAGQMKYIRELMESRPFLTRVPDQSVVVDDYDRDPEHVQATRDESGSYAMVYTSWGKAVTVRLDKLSGAKVRAWWYDPRTGKATLIGEFDGTGQRKFTPPTSGKNNDWVLVVDDASKNFPAPGA
jgi:Protein of unknown function (DUF4038)/Putative collagen-binding domain of a collagenase/PA14 domain